MEKRRLTYLDQMKGVAIFFMVMGHVMLFSFKESNSMIEGFGVSNMPMFFYVSGFLAYCELNNITNYVQRLAKRRRRLMIPWLCVTIAMCFYAGRPFVPTLLSFYWFLAFMDVCIQTIGLESLYLVYDNYCIGISSNISVESLFAMVHW